VKPVQYSIWTPEEPILGALKYVQPGGAAVSMQLTQAPTLGTVQLLSSGDYTYTPGPDFTGTDSFTAEVTAGGFNVLEPFTPRTVSVVVNIKPRPLLMASESFFIRNLSAKGVYLSSIRKDKGYESSVESLPVGTILKPGDWFRVEMTYWAFYSHTAYFTFYGCFDESCGPSSPTTDKEWTVKIGTLLALGLITTCQGGRCDERGTGIIDLLA
jgi:hypothetical protein